MIELLLKQEPNPQKIDMIISCYLSVPSKVHVYTEWTDRGLLHEHKLVLFYKYDCYVKIVILPSIVRGTKLLFGTFSLNLK
jgi:hypothetical protein